jgi:hypothetical protein
MASIAKFLRTDVQGIKNGKKYEVRVFYLYNQSVAFFYTPSTHKCSYTKSFPPMIPPKFPSASKYITSFTVGSQLLDLHQITKDNYDLIVSVTTDGCYPVTDSGFLNASAKDLSLSVATRLHIASGAQVSESFTDVVVSIPKAMYEVPSVCTQFLASDQLHPEAAFYMNLLSKNSLRGLFF